MKTPVLKSQSSTTYFDFERINAMDPIAFRAQKPFPWINPKGLLTEEGYQRLLAMLPDISLFEKSFGMERKHGQECHDRYTLEYSPELDIPPTWKDFIAELRGEEYRTFVRRLFGVSSFDLNFHWHYAPNGCGVSPHCDARRKVGSHLFYLNTTADWDPAWGGETVVLDDGGRLAHSWNPKFEDLEYVASSQTVGNYSFLFARTEHSWHGVREIHCPPNRLRKIFIVVINYLTPAVRLRRLFGGRLQGY